MVLFLVIFITNIKNTILMNYFFKDQPCLFKKLNKLNKNIKSITCNDRSCNVNTYNVGSYEYSYNYCLLDVCTPLNYIDSIGNYAFQITQNTFKVTPELDKNIAPYEYVTPLNILINAIRGSVEELTKTYISGF